VYRGCRRASSGSGSSSSGRWQRLRRGARVHHTGGALSALAGLPGDPQGGALSAVRGRYGGIGCGGTRGPGGGALEWGGRGPRPADISVGHAGAADVTRPGASGLPGSRRRMQQRRRQQEAQEGRGRGRKGGPGGGGGHEMPAGGSGLYAVCHLPRGFPERTQGCWPSAFSGTGCHATPSRSHSHSRSTPRFSHRTSSRSWESLSALAAAAGTVAGARGPGPTAPGTPGRVPPSTVRSSMSSCSSTKLPSS